MCAVLLSTSVALAAAEYATRALTTAPTATDSVLGRRGTPGGDRDAEGFRNAAIPAQADIVALGDSQTEGNNATREEAWPQVLGNLTGDSVYQMAVGGWAPPQYRALVDEALAKKPRLVILAFYTGNDLLETAGTVYRLPAWAPYRRADFALAGAAATSQDIRIALDAGVAPESLASRILSIRMYLRSNLRLYALIGDATRTLRERLGLASVRAEKDRHIASLVAERPDIGAVVDDPRVKTVLSPSYRLATVDVDTHDAAEGWRLAKVLIAETKSAVEKSNASFALVIIPTKELAYLSSNARSEFPAESFAGYEAAERHLLAELKAYCEETHTTCVSVLPALAGAISNGTAVYGKTLDGHPVAAGYAVMAEAIRKGLSLLAQAAPAGRRNSGL